MIKYNFLYLILLLELSPKSGFCAEIESYLQILPIEIFDHIITSLSVSDACFLFCSCKQFHEAYGDAKDYLFDNTECCSKLSTNTYLAGLTCFAQRKNKRMLCYLLTYENREQGEERLKLSEFFGYEMPDKSEMERLLMLTIHLCNGKTKYKKASLARIAIEEDNKQACKLLIKNGIMIKQLFYNAHRGTYFNFFTWATARPDYVELLKLLKRVNAKPNAKGNKGNTLLHRVVGQASADPQLVEMLICCGADVNKENDLHYRPIDYARSAAVRKILIDNGAEISWWDKLFCYCDS